MSKTIDFYFDFSSPYGYFASTGIDSLAAKYGREVKWHALLLGAIFKTTGGAPLPSLPLKGDYSLHDMERSARFHGIDYRRPAQFPIPTQLAARAMLWVEQEQGQARAAEFAKAVYRAYFFDGADIVDPKTIAALASGMGLDAAALIEAANSAPLKEKLRAENDAALARGVFGSPFMIADGEPFWGFDRFDQLEAFLKNGTI